MQMEVTGRSFASKKTKNMTAQSKSSAKNTAVIPVSELNRMKTFIATGQTISNIEEDRRKLKEISDNRTQNWSNTILALRKRKEQDKFEKFAKEEMERREIEQDEARYQQGEKAILLDAAKRQIFERNDKVKTLHSKMLYSDALQERELQKAIDKDKKKMQSEIEVEYHDEIIRQCAAFDAKEEEKRNEVAKVKLRNQMVLKDQHDQFREKHVHRHMEDKLQGEILKIKAKQAEQQAIADERARFRKVKDAQEETKKGNDLLKQIKEQDRLKGLEEDKKIEEYSKQRERIIAARKAEAERVQAEKQAIRQKMIDKALVEIKAKKDEEDIKIAKDIVERQTREENIEKEKLEKVARLKADIDYHRNICLSEKGTKKITEQQEGKDFVKFWEEKNKEIERTIKQERQNRYDMNKQLCSYQQQQANEKMNQRERELMREMEEDEMIRNAIENDEKEFNTYAKRCLEQWEGQGKNVTPIVLELQKQRRKNLDTL